MDSFFCFRIYGFSYRKRTAIWTNIDWIPKCKCKQDCNFCILGRHIGHFGTGGTNCSYKEKISIPPHLLKEILGFIEFKENELAKPQ